jgi:hypothetical protein
MHGVNAATALQKLCLHSLIPPFLLFGIRHELSRLTHWPLRLIKVR